MSGKSLSPEGELGGIVSLGHVSQHGGGEPATVGAPTFASEGGLPKGLLKKGIHFLSSFSDVLGEAWEMLKSVRRSMRVQLPMVEESTSKTGLKEDIFPLPVSQVDPKKFSTVRAALNDLSGHHPFETTAEATIDEREEKKGLERIIERFDSWTIPKPEVNFATVFKTKDVSYSGEEIKIAQTLNWKAVEPSLPEGVGMLPLQEFCRLGTLEYVLNFENYMLPEDMVKVPRPPKVQVASGSWNELCQGLVDRNICEVWPVDDLYHHDEKPLVNGLFAVGKGEYIGEVETQRLIMNLTPVNALCRNLAGDVSTLPGLSGFSGFTLEEGEVGLFSSEDIRCFFYLFSIPDSWKRFMGFNRLVDESLIPAVHRGKECVLVSRVLPMGFVNSVSIAQHIHRNVVRWSSSRVPTPIGGEGEMRKDKGQSSSSELFRIYLDNFDQIERVDASTADLIKGTPSAQILQLRSDYAELCLPRHPKKAVVRQPRAEIQGALFDGEAGYAMAKPSKVWQYAILGMELLQRNKASLKELQVTCGGFVYIAMFRRPLLCALNEVWRFMQELVDRRLFTPQVLPLSVAGELARFILLIPLAQMEFRARLCEQVTCSDASMLGGGLCVSEGLTSYGVSAANSQVRGDVPEEHDLVQVLTVGLFDGIAALRLAADTLGLPVAGHVSVEKDPRGRRVVESWFPDTTFFEDILEFGEEQVQDLALKYSNVGLVIIGAGPPCQGVSGLNYDKKWALRDERSSLFKEVPRVTTLFKKHFPWAQVHRVMESVASMSSEDRVVMTSSVGDLPYKLDCFGLTLCHRPRLFWPSWELSSCPGVVVAHPPDQGPQAMGHVSFFGQPREEALLEPGWHLASDQGLPTFTTSRPSSSPGRRPAGLSNCQEHELERWRQDWHRFPPYQYRDQAGLWNKKHQWRRPSVKEREALMGFPIGYTAPCLPKQEQKGESYDDARLTLLGNSWQVGVIVWLLSQLCAPLGLCRQWDASEIVQALTPGVGANLQSILLRPPLTRSGPVLSTSSSLLVRKLLGLISMKGEGYSCRGVVKCWCAITGWGPVYQLSFGNGRRLPDGVGGPIPTILISLSCVLSWPLFDGGSKERGFLHIGFFILLTVWCVSTASVGAVHQAGNWEGLWYGSMRCCLPPTFTPSGGTFTQARIRPTGRVVDLLEENGESETAPWRSE